MKIPQIKIEKQAMKMFKQTVKELREAHEEYKQRNGLPYCKNCGIDLEGVANVLQLAIDMIESNKIYNQENKK